MTITVRYFASLREVMGPSEMLPWPIDGLAGFAEGITVQALREHLAARGGPSAQALASGRALRCAINQTMAADHDMVRDGAEVAFFPPVTGG